MSLSAAAPGVASAIASALNGDATAQEAWNTAVQKIYDGIVANLTVTLPSGTVITVGSATTQTGPTIPVPCTLL